MFSFMLLIVYLSFISLGLPDGLLGAVWPSLYGPMNVPVSYSGIVFMIISCGTVISSLMSDRLTRWLGAGKVTVISVALTCAALFGFSLSNRFWMLCLWAIPYGLGAGSVDAALNNYVALHYESKHMSWLHCMWGLGALTGPVIMGAVLTAGHSWQWGYRSIGLIQAVLVGVLIYSLPRWKHRPDEAAPDAVSAKPLSLRQIFAIPGAKAVLVMFFCYCALEQTIGLWASSYLVLKHGMEAEAAAGFASLFFIGITAGRFLSGFIAMRLRDETMIRLGMGITAVGILLMLLPLGRIPAMVGLVIVGLGCAPIYPCVIHSTPQHFGAENSQALVGVQMASAYLGNMLMGPFYGVLAGWFTMGLFPFYLAILLAVGYWMHEKLCRQTAH